MPKPVFVLDSTPLWKGGPRSLEVKAGDWLRPINGRLPPSDLLAESWLWQVVLEKGQLVLRADGVATSRRLTQQLVSGFRLVVPSQRVRLADYLELLGWYRACRWGLVLTDRDDGWVQLHLQRYGSRLTTEALGAIPAADVGQPEVVWLHLLDALYSLVHPRRADALLANGHLPPPERDRFVRELRRKAVKRTAAAA